MPHGNIAFTQHHAFVFHLQGGSIMDGPIYVFFRARFTAAWYQLSQTEKDNLLAENDALGKQFGYKQLIMCNSRWSNERWYGFGVEEFPNMATFQKYNVALEESGWFRYVDSETMLGTAWT
jgi:hypothetical protein